MTDKPSRVIAASEQWMVGKTDVEIQREQRYRDRIEDLEARCERLRKVAFAGMPGCLSLVWRVTILHEWAYSIENATGAKTPVSEYLHSIADAIDDLKETDDRA